MPKRTLPLVCCFMLLLVAVDISPLSAQNGNSVTFLEVEVIDEISHINDSWTQGLLIYDGSLFESTGNYGNSSLKELDINNGSLIRELEFNETYFAEGIAVVNETLILLTWRENVAFRIDLSTFEVTSNHSYQGEGWGLCYDGTYLIMSDGTSELHFRDPSTFEIIKTLNVTINGDIFDGQLNELECVEETIYANIWYENEIVIIDSNNGNITSVIEVSGLESQNETTYHEILNGIAYDENNNTFLITGKNWPSIYRVKFIEKQNSQLIVDENTEDVDDEISVTMPILAVTFALIVWVIDVKFRRKVKDEVDKADTTGEV